MHGLKSLLYIVEFCFYFQQEIFHVENDLLFIFVRLLLCHVLFIHFCSSYFLSMKLLYFYGLQEILALLKACQILRYVIIFLQSINHNQLP